MADSDWLYSVGIDTTQATQDVQKFIDQTTGMLKGVSLRIGVENGKAASKTINDIQAQVSRLNNTEGVVKLNTGRANQSLSSLTANVNKATTAVEDLKAVSSGNLGNLGSSFSNSAKGANALASSLGGVGRAARSQGDALDFLGRIAQNTMFKFIEYELIMNGFNAVIGEVKRSLDQAGNVELEKTIQGLYNLDGAGIDVNKTFQNAQVIAEQWGADIIDVQQTIALWTKNVKDLGAATYLANQAEMMHRASGIDSQEVYRDSIAILSQMGLTAAALPKIYDQVSEAALKMALPLKSLTGGKMEGMKSLMQGLTQTAATMRAFGFDTAGALAVVSNQITATSDDGKKAANNISQMFARLGSGGTSRENFFNIIGHDVHGTDAMIQSMQVHIKQLYAAYAKGDLGVKPQQFETLQTFESNLENIAKIYHDIQNNSKGKLQLISDAEMNTFNGQMARMKSEIQGLTIALGTQLLPGATDLARMLNSNVLPALTHMVGPLVEVTRLAAGLGVAWLGLLAINKVGASVQGFASAVRTASASNALFREGLMTDTVALSALDGSYIGIDGQLTKINITRDQAIVQMNAEKAAIAELATSYEALNWVQGENVKAAEAAELTYGEVALVAGTKMPTALESAGLAMKGFGLAVASSLGPLIAVYMAMQAVMGISQAFDRRQNFELGLKMTNENKGQRVGEFVTHWDEASRYATAGLLGRGSEVDEAAKYKQQMLHWGSQGHGGGNAVRAYQLQQQILNTPNGSHRRALQDAQNAIIQQQWDSHHNDVSGYDDATALTDRIQKALKAQFGNPNATEAPEYGKKKADHTMAPIQDVFKHSVDNVKGYFSGMQSFYKNVQKAGVDAVATQKQLADQIGVTQQRMQAFKAGYEQQIAGVQGQEGATRWEIASLEKRVTEGKSLMSKQKPGSNAWETEATAVRAAEEAINKARGALVDYGKEIAKIAAQEKLSQVHEQNMLDLHNLSPGGYHWSFGVPGGTSLKESRSLDTFEDYRTRLSDITNAGKSGEGDVQGMYNEQNASGSILDQVKSLDALRKSASNSGDTKFLQALDQLITQYVNAWRDANKAVTAHKTAIDSTSQSIQDLGQNLVGKNTDDMATLLYGDDAKAKAGLTNLKETIAAYKEVRSEQEQLAQLEAKYGPAETQDEKNAVKGVQQEIDLRARLIPLMEQERARLAQIKQVEASNEFKSTNSLLDSWGGSRMNKIVSTAFPKSGSDNPFVKGIAGYISSSWDTAAGSITKSLFGVNTNQNPEQAALQKIYDEHVQGLNLFEQKFAKDSGGLDTSLDSFATSIKGDFTPGITRFGTSVQALNGEGASATSVPSGGLAYQMYLMNQADGAASGGTGTGSSSAAGGSTSTAATDTTNDALTQLNKTNKTISDALSGAPGSVAGKAATTPPGAGSTSANAIEKALAPILGQSNAESTGILANFNSIFAPGGAFGMTQTKNPDGTTTNSDNIGGAVSGLGMAVSGYEQGGVAGGIQSAIGAYGTATSLGAPPQVAIPIAAAAGLFSAFSFHGNATNEPDVYNTQQYGQYIANLTGAGGAYYGQNIANPNSKEIPYGSFGANGSQFVSNVSSVTNGQTGIAFIEELLSKYSVAGTTQEAAGAPSWLKPMWNQLVQAFGISATGSGDMKFGKGSSASISGALGATNTNGETYQTLGNLLNTALNGYSQNNSSALAPILMYNVSGASQGPSIYNSPGMDQSTFLAEQQAGFSGLQNAYSFFNTPSSATGSGTSYPQPVATNASGTQSSIVVPITLTLDGQVLAQVVNSYNASAASRNTVLA